MIFLKSVIGGVVTSSLVWVLIVSIHLWRITQIQRQRLPAQLRQGNTGLVAVAGGWNYLLHQPLIVLLLAASFGVGVYLAARFGLRLRTATWILVALIVIGGLVWELRGVTFYSAHVVKKDTDTKR
jgi:hypothetical protein